MKQKICIGMMRPLWAETWENLDNKCRGETKCPGCGMTLNDWNPIRMKKDTYENHYLVGHFDTPVYKETE